MILTSCKTNQSIYKTTITIPPASIPMIEIKINPRHPSHGLLGHQFRSFNASQAAPVPKIQTNNDAPFPTTITDGVAYRCTKHGMGRAET